MKLTGKDVEQLQNALLSAYPTRTKLERLVRIKLDEQLAGIATGDNLKDVIFQLITWAESKGRIAELIDKAYRYTPNNPDLKAFAQQLNAAPPLEKDEFKPIAPPIDEELLQGHFFISYAPADGYDLALTIYKTLKAANIPVWLDEKNPSTAAAEALDTCKGVLALLTAASLAPESKAREQWQQALRYKKAIIPIRLDKLLNSPPELGKRKIVELQKDTSKGLSHLIQRLETLDTPRGRLFSLQNRLTDLKIALTTINDPNVQAFIRTEIANLSADIKLQEKIVKNPKQAYKRRLRQIKQQSRLWATQISPPPSNGPHIINSLETTVPDYFQGRHQELKQIHTFLSNVKQNLLLITGRGGMGKTVLVQHSLDSLSQTDPQAIQSIIYLTVHHQQRLDSATLYHALLPLLPVETAERLQNYFKNAPQQITANFKALLQALPTHAPNQAAPPLAPVVFVLDNFETALDPLDGTFLDAGLMEALETILKTAHHRLKIIITSRIAPPQLAYLPSGNKKAIILKEGLTRQDMKAMFKQRDPDNHVGLKKIKKEALKTLHNRTQGNPRALEALYDLLQQDYTTTLNNVLANINSLLPEKVLGHLIGQIFSRLDPVAQQIMQILAIYGVAVAAPAVEDVLQPYHPGLQVAPLLRRLTNRHLVRFKDERYSLHPTDQAYALSRLAVGEPENKRKQAHKSTPPFTRFSLYQLAADHLIKQRPPAQTWHTLKDLDPLLTEFDLRLKSQAYEKAAAILALIGHNYLLQWSYYDLIIELWAKLPPKTLKWQTNYKRLQDIGNAYLGLGQAKTALAYFEEQQSMLSNKKEDATKNAMLVNLANCYQDLGRITEAISYYQQSLNSIHTQLGHLSRMDGGAKRMRVDLKGQRQGLKINEAICLGGLGNCYSTLGQINKSIDYYHQALAINQEIGNRQGIANSYGNLGNQYAILGDIDKAIDYHHQALVIKQEIGDRQGIATSYENLGSQYATLGDIDKAIDYYHQSLAIYQEIGDRSGEASALDNLGLHHATLGDIDKAIDYHHQSLAIEQEIGTRQGEAASLNNLGDVFVIQGNLTEAKVQYQKALTIGAAIGTPDIQNYAGRGLGTVYLYEGQLNKARTAIRKARDHTDPRYDHQLFSLWGLITLRQEDLEHSSTAFSQALTETDRLLGYTATNFEVLYSQGLALCGLALCVNGGVISAEAKKALQSLTTGWAAMNSTDLITAALASYQEAIRVSQAPGYQQKAVALFKALAVADTEDLLAPIQQVLE